MKQVNTCTSTKNCNATRYTKSNIKYQMSIFKVWPFLEALAKTPGKEYCPYQSLFLQRTLLRSRLWKVVVWECADLSNNHTCNLQMYSGLDTIDNNVTEPKLGNHIVWSYSNNSSETSPLILHLFYTFVEMGKKRFHSFKYPFLDWHVSLP